MFKKQTLWRVALALLLMLLCVLCFAACKQDPPPAPPADTTVAIERTGHWTNATYVENQTLGDGAKTVKVRVIVDDQAITLTIKTDKSTLREVMEEHELIGGTEDQYGLYVKTVNGILVDYNVDGYWWGITKNGEQTSTGVDNIQVSDGEQYEFTRTNTF